MKKSEKKSKKSYKLTFINCSVLLKSEYELSASTDDPVEEKNLELKQKNKKN